MGASRKEKCSTCLMYCFLSFIVGFDFTLRSTRVVYYLKEIKVLDIPMYQGMLTVVGQLSGTVAALVFGYLNDKYGNTKLLLTVINMTMFIGVFIYSIPMSPINMIIGLILRGIYLGGYAIGLAEMARMFKGKDLTTAMSCVNVGNLIGSIIGPLMNFWLHYIDIDLHIFSIKPFNAPGFLTCILIIIFQVLLMIFLKESTEIQDNKNSEVIESIQLISFKRIYMVNECIGDGEGSKYDITGKLIESPLRNPPIDKLSLYRNLKILLYSKDLLFLYICTFLWTFLLMSLEAIVPLVAVQWLNMPSISLGYTYIGRAMIGIFINFMLALFKKPQRDLQMMVILALVQLFIPCIFIWIYRWNLSGRNVDILFYVWVISAGMTWMLEDVLLKSICSRFVPLKMQGFSEGFRMLPRAIGMIFAGFISGIWFKNVLIVSSIIVSIQIVLIILLIWRMKSLKYPQRMTDVIVNTDTVET